MKLKYFDVTEEVFDSPALRGNPAGDPHRRTVPVVVPRTRGGTAGQRFPVLFVLAGFTGAGRSFLNWSAWSPSLPERLDALRQRGVIGDMIVVFPDGFTRFGGSQYINSTATGQYEDMIVQDLVAWTEARYPVLPGARHRAIAGKSSGGYAALVLGMRHPDVFSAVACHSGDMYFEYCYRQDFPRLLRQLEKYGGVEGFIKAFDDAPKKTTDLILTMNIIAMAAAYSPNAGSPGGMDLPVNPRTGEIDAGVWKRWLEHDPVRLCERYAGNLRKLRLLFLDCGKRDQFHLQYGMRILCEKLKALDISHAAEEFDDDHTGTSYRYDTSIPKVWEAIR